MHQTEGTLVLAVVVFDSCVFELANFVEVFKCNQLLLEILRVEVGIVIVPKDLVILEPLLEQFLYLGCC